MKFISSILLILLMALMACSNSEQAGLQEVVPEVNQVESSSATDTVPVLEGFVYIDAADSLINLLDASVYESPALKAVFNYNFYLSRHETTCGEFNTLMKPVTGLVLDCENDSLPATNLTFYDAILWANERSKSEGLDTAYSYMKRSLDSEKHCIDLEGLEFHSDKDSYRLPTEAEWVFAARRCWNPQENAWTAENSDFQLHTVCSLANEEEVCDLVGNAMEWVNDWYGSFRDTIVTNYVGALDGGPLSQRVVKGGSFRNYAQLIHIYGRNDVYVVTSSTRADYVGFRLARGSIPDAVWLANNGNVVSSKITPLASTSSVHTYTRTHKTKLVFRNDMTGNLAFIDYSSGSLSVVEIVDSINAYHPDISPDGNHVAFCTMIEGVDGKSSLYVRDLNADGSNLVKLNVKSAAIPRWRVLENGDTVIVYVTSVGNNKDESSFRSSSTWQVKFSNGKFGKPEKLFDGTYHGGVSTGNQLAVSSSRLLRARIDERDTIWYNGEQTCNASLSKDGKNQTLFLDFAGSTGKKFVGGKYAVHQRILVADSSGKLIQSVAAPKGFTFDHTEWASRIPGVAVATLTDINGVHSEIVLVNMSNGKILQLAKGTELWHPCLWSAYVSEEQTNGPLDLDSACVYMTENSSMATRIMKTKMDLFWKWRDSADVVVIGSSRTFSGIDPEYIQSHFAINMAYAAEDMEATLFYVKNYVLPLMTKIKVVVLALDYDRWVFKGDNWENWFSNIPGYEYDKNHDFWKDGLKGDMYAISLNTLSPTPDEALWYDYHRGLSCTSTGGWGSETPSVDYDSLWFDKDPSGMDYNLQRLKTIVQLAQERDVDVVGIVFPQSPYYKNTGSWGRYGPSHESVKIMQDSVSALMDEYPNFIVWDEYRDGYNDYTYEEFSNEDHLSCVGAVKITNRLDSLLKELDERR